MILRHLQPGDTFRVRATGQLAVLVKINDCRAYVKIHGETIQKGFEANGKWVEFTSPGGRYDNWAPSTEVDLVIESSTLKEAGIL